MQMLPLANGGHATVDDEDYAAVQGHDWRLRYVCRGGSRVRPAAVVAWINGEDVSLHRLLLRVEPSMVVDHIDGDTLNNTRANLRVCLQSQNCKNRRIGKNNTSGHKGVHFRRDKGPRAKRWRAMIYHDGKRHDLGYYGTPEEAAKAYKDASKRLHGEFGRAA